MTMKAAVCLLSGGLDSATTLFYTIKENFRVLALTVDYGQIHRRELESAKKITNYLKIEHEIISIELPWKGSALLDETIPIPQNRDTTEISKEIPVTYVPARNTIFLSLAASYAEVRGASAIFIGANAINIYYNIADTYTDNAYIIAGGANGANTTEVDYSYPGAGGGGSGGSIVIKANSITNQNTNGIVAGGGIGGTSTYYYGGAGGGGRTYAEYNSLTGSDPGPNYASGGAPTD